MTWIRVLQVVIALGLLIFVHELGHFLAAKWAGVRVEVFSFGFGPFILSYKRGETIYAISLIPFGGYVRMTGQADVGHVKDRDRHVPWSYLAKSPGKRAVIIVAGVTMNLVFAYLLFVPALLIGYADVPAEVGDLAGGSPAHGRLLRGDRILSINGAAVTRWSDFEAAVATSEAGAVVALVVERNGAPLAVEVTSVENPRSGLASLGVYAPTEIVELPIGASTAPGLGVLHVEADSPGALAGLKPLDYIGSVNGQPFDGLEGFQAALRRSAEAAVVLGVVRDGRPLEVSVTPKKIDETTFIVGFKPSEEVIGDVEELSAAYAAGLRRGDFIVDTVPPKPQSVEIGWQRPDGSKHSAVIPIVQGAAALRLELIKQEPIWCGFTDVWWGAARETRRAVSMTYDVLLGLLSRRVPVGSMSGLPQIVAMTYRSAKSGMGYYLWLVAVISVNLAVINLFPMVPLDGGLLIFLLYEALRGRPANPRIQETAQLVGAMLLLVLIVYVTQNDFVRLFS